MAGRPRGAALALLVAVTIAANGVVRSAEAQNGAWRGAVPAAVICGRQAGPCCQPEFTVRHRRAPPGRLHASEVR